MSVVYYSPMESLSDFDTSTAGVALSTNTGYSGNSIRVTYSGNYQQQIFRKTLPAGASVVQFRIKIASSATLNGNLSGTGSTGGDAVIYTEFTTSAFEGDTTIPIQIRVIESGSGFAFHLVSPADGYTGDYANNGTFALGVWHTVTLYKTATAYNLYVDASPTVLNTYSRTNSSATATYIHLGNNYSVQDALNGVVDFDDLFTKNLNTITTEADRINDAIEAIQQRYDSNGAAIRPIDPTGGQTAPDVVSESVAYLLKNYAQTTGYQALYDRAFTWAYNNLRRGSTPGMSPTTNTPTNAFNLYAFKYNVDSHVVADANWAGDADHEIAQSLLWMHARYGSAGTVNYLARAQEIMSDIRNYAISQSSATGYYYLMNDSFQKGNTTVQMGGDYDDPAAYRLFAQYDSANAATWNLLAQGAYDIITKQANYIFSPQTSTVKLNTNWSQFNLNTGAVSGTSTYGDSDWGYNSFRGMPRVYDDLKWYGTSAAVTALQLPKAFLTSQYAANTAIYAEYKHDGTVKGAYESSLFYYPYYYSLTAGDASNTTGAAIASNKFPSYTVHPAGGYFGAPGYFGDMWMPVYRRQVSNTYVNYGQAMTTTKTQTATSRIAINKTTTQGAVARIANTGIPRTNIIVNPRYAVNVTDGTIKYGTSGTNGIQLSVDTTKGVAPNTTALKIMAGTDGAQFVDGGVMLNYTLPAGVTYTASVYIATASNGTGGGIQNAHFVVRQDNGFYVFNQVHVTSDTGGVFTRYSITFTTGITGIHTILLGLGSYGSTSQGIAWFTNIMLERQSNLNSYFDGATPGAAWNGTADNSTSSITGSVQTAKARIVRTVTKTQTATARIQSGTVLTKTQTTKARISRTVTKTQTATARLIKTVVKTQTTTARIAKNFTKTQTSISRIALNRTNTQTATARIARSLTQTQTSVSRISNTFIYTQPSRALIAKQLTKIQTVTARVVQTTTASMGYGFNQQPFNGLPEKRFANATTQSSTARIAGSYSAVQTAKARISRISTTNQPAIARIAKSGLIRTNTAISKIANNLTRVQSAVARVIANTGGTNTQSATARIAINKTTTQTARSRIAQSYTKVQSATAKIITNTLRSSTQPAVSRIATIRTKTQTVKASIANKRVFAITAKAAIITNSIVSKQQTATAHITSVVQKIQPGISRIANSRLKTQTTKARIARNGSRVQSAIARIDTSRIRSTTQTAITRLSRTLSFTQSAKTRIAINVTTTQVATARIDAYLHTQQTATALIVTTIHRTTPIILRNDDATVYLDNDSQMIVLDNDSEMIIL